MEEMTKTANTYGGAGVTSAQAYALAAGAEVRAFGAKVSLGYPSGRAVLVARDLQRQVGDPEAFRNALQQHGFTLSDRMAKEGRIIIGVIDPVKDVVNNVVPSTGEPETEIKRKYKYAIEAYQRAKEAYDANQTSLDLKAAALVMGLTQESTSFTKRNLASILGEADIEGVLNRVKDLGVSVEKVDDHESGFIATASTEDTVYWIIEVKDLATLEACQKAAINKMWPTADEDQVTP